MSDALTPVCEPLIKSPISSPLRFMLDYTVQTVSIPFAITVITVDGLLTVPKQESSSVFAFILK